MTTLMCLTLKELLQFKGKSELPLKGVHDAQGYIACSFWIQLTVKYIKATDNISHLNNRNFFKYWFTSSLG